MHRLCRSRTTSEKVAGTVPSPVLLGFCVELLSVKARGRRRERGPCPEALEHSSAAGRPPALPRLPVHARQALAHGRVGEVANEHLK